MQRKGTLPSASAHVYRRAKKSTAEQKIFMTEYPACFTKIGHYILPTNCFQFLRRTAVGGVAKNAGRANARRPELTKVGRLLMQTPCRGACVPDVLCEGWRARRRRRPEPQAGDVNQSEVGGRCCFPSERRSEARRAVGPRARTHTSGGAILYPPLCKVFPAWASAGGATRPYIRRAGACLTGMFVAKPRLELPVCAAHQRLAPAVRSLPS